MVLRSADVADWLSDLTSQRDTHPEGGFLDEHLSI